MTGLKKNLNGIPLARSTYCLGLRIRSILRDAWSEPASFDRLYSREKDPWGYGPSEEEQLRHLIAAEMLDSVLQGKQFPSVFEIGCGEGKFTFDHLAPRSRSLVATDFSTAALKHARSRVSEKDHQVKIEGWELRSDPAPDPADLVVAMDILDYIPNPWEVFRARSKIFKCLKPGGYLLLSVNYSVGYEHFWWSKFLLAGGEHIVHVFEHSPKLRLVSKAATPHHYIALFMKVDAAV
jgi:SAM-dependent methyltransferase